jgi:hypothetical protein
MIRVTVEIWPGGFPGGKRKIGAMSIANVTDLAPLSDYEADIWEAGNPLARSEARECSVQVRNHSRRLGVWSLIAKVLEQARREGFNE